FKENIKNHFGPLKYEDPKGALSKLLQLAGVVSIKPTTLGDMFSLARTIKACFGDQTAPVAGTLAGVKANKVVNNGDDSESSGPVTPTSDSESSDEVLVDGKQDEAKVVAVADEQNNDEPDVLEGNGVIGGGVNKNYKGVDKEFQYSVYTLHVLISFLEHLNDQLHKEEKYGGCNSKKIMGSWNQDFFRQHLEGKVVVKEWECSGGQICHFEETWEECRRQTVMGTQPPNAYRVT
nr:harbinger transposase-derived nuclease domain-containing protein [Tanacetum cinerariifolium]